MIDRYSTVRGRMVHEQLMSRGINDEKTLASMSEVPRHLFVDKAQGSRSYGDHPLPIASGQTISQPFIVAVMTQSLHLHEEGKVLEVGTGSGYQAAVLARICKHVYTVERIPALLSSARKTFDSLSYYNIHTKLDDGTLGWPEHGPYDAIIVTAGGPEIPSPLIEQLSESGRLVMPVGNRYSQELQLIVKKGSNVETRHLEYVRFVELIGEHGWKR